MNLEGRKDNTYFDKNGLQILIGDLLKVFHFKSGRKTFYMYHVVVMEETGDFPVMSVKDYYADKPHYRMYAVADNEQRYHSSAEIIGMQDYKTKRKKIKISHDRN